MDLSFWLRKLTNDVEPEDKFQSLLWWICLFDHTIHLSTSVSLNVSILVMMDLSFWLFLSFRYLWEIFEFQSLLWWICLFDFLNTSLLEKPLRSFNPCYDGFVFLTYMHHCLPKFHHSFNPCYDGFVFLTSGAMIRDAIKAMFQSLLWWICLFDVCLSFGYRTLWAVSILVMMDLSFWLDEAYLLFPDWLFQSLLWWICLFDSN